MSLRLRSAREINTACDHFALDSLEPQLDLVEPEGVGRGVVDVDVGMSGQEFAYGGVLWAERLSQMI